MTNLTESDVFAMLTEIRQGLDRDGYDLDIAVDERIGVRIVARPDACEDCLVGKNVMTKILLAALRDAEESLEESDIELTYPAEGHP